MAGEDGAVNREELEKAQGGDLGLFDKMNHDPDDNVDQFEWWAHLVQTYTLKEAQGEGKGSKWISNLMHTLDTRMDWAGTPTLAQLTLEDTGGVATAIAEALPTLIRDEANSIYIRLAGENKLLKKSKLRNSLKHDAADVMFRDVDDDKVLRAPSP